MRFKNNSQQLCTQSNLLNFTNNKTKVDRTLVYIASRLKC